MSALSGSQKIETHFVEECALIEFEGVGASLYRSLPSRILLSFLLLLSSFTASSFLSPLLPGSLSLFPCALACCNRFGIEGLFEISPRRAAGVPFALLYASERKRKHAGDQMRDHFPIFAMVPCCARPSSLASAHLATREFLDHYVWQPPTRTPTPPAFALNPGSITLDEDDSAPTDRRKYDLS